MHWDGENLRIVSSVDVTGAAESVQIAQAIKNVVRVSTRRDYLEGVRAGMSLGGIDRGGAAALGSSDDTPHGRVRGGFKVKTDGPCR